MNGGTRKKIDKAVKEQHRANISESLKFINERGLIFRLKVIICIVFKSSRPLKLFYKNPVSRKKE